MSTALIEPPAQGPAPQAKAPRRKKQSKIVPLLLVLAGILVLLYPVVATYMANRNQSVVSQVYTDTTSEISQEQNDATIGAAKRYNADSVGGPILDPWLARIREDNAAYMEYLKQLDFGTDAMARVVIPSIHSDLPIYHGTTEEVLEKGIGHLFGTSLPVGGEGTHAVLTGHTGLTRATLWDNLTDVKPGDAVYIQVGLEKMKYQVDGSKVVLPEETQSLHPEPGADKLTLVTCTPYGINSHRLLVEAHRVPMDAEGEQVFSEPLTPWQNWMTWVLVAVTAIILFILITYLRQKNKQRSGKAEA